MEKFEDYGVYVIQRFPRKRIYRAFRKGEFGNYKTFCGKMDFKSPEELKYAIRKHEELPSKLISNDPYNTAIRWLRNASKEDENYKEVERLVSQYYYGMDARMELEELLISMQVLNNC